MVGAAVPFLLIAYLTGAALIVTGVAFRLWVNLLTGAFLIICLTTALR